MRLGGGSGGPWSASAIMASSVFRDQCFLLFDIVCVFVVSSLQVQLPCQHCKKPFRRTELRQHEQTECPQRTAECKHCASQISLVHMNEHLNRECQGVEVACSLKCGKSMVTFLKANLQIVEQVPNIAAFFHAGSRADVFSCERRMSARSD